MIQGQNASIKGRLAPLSHEPYLHPSFAAVRQGRNGGHDLYLEEIRWTSVTNARAVYMQRVQSRYQDVTLKCFTEKRPERSKARRTSVAKQLHYKP